LLNSYAVPATLSRSAGPQTIQGDAGDALTAVRPVPQPPDPAQTAGAVARFMVLREFHTRLYGCLTARPDALFELTDAILCADPQ
jgi:hypothetical protein